MALLGTLTWHEKFIHDSFFIVIPGLGGDIYVCSWTPSANSVVYLCYYLTACGVVALHAYSLIVPCYIERLYCSEEKNLVMIRYLWYLLMVLFGVSPLCLSVFILTVYDGHCRWNFFLCSAVPIECMIGFAQHPHSSPRWGGVFCNWTISSP